MSTLAKYLDSAIRAAGVPLIGVSVGDEADRATWKAQLDPSATGAQAQTAVTILATFDPATVPTLAADSDAVLQTNNKAIKALVVYIWKLNHSNANPTGPQLQAELATLKAIYKAL